jgi:hypothetical protein
VPKSMPKEWKQAIADIAVTRLGEYELEEPCSLIQTGPGPRKNEHKET